MTKTAAMVEAEINQLQAKLAPMRSQLDAHVEEFAKEVVPLAEAWMKGQVQRSIEANSAILETLPADQVRHAKAQIAALYDELPELARSRTQDVTERPHNQPHIASHIYNTPTYFEDVYKSLVFRIAVPLHEVGLLREGGGLPLGSWERSGSDAFRYRNHAGFEQSKLPSVGAYTKAKFDYERVRGQLNSALAELPKAKARELWDKT